MGDYGDEVIRRRIAICFTEDHGQPWCTCTRHLHALFDCCGGPLLTTSFPRACVADSGTVVDFDGNRHLIKYVDGDQRWHNLGSDEAFGQLRWLEADAPLTAFDAPQNKRRYTKRAALMETTPPPKRTKTKERPPAVMTEAVAAAKAAARARALAVEAKLRDAVKMRDAARGRDEAAAMGTAWRVGDACEGRYRAQRYGEGLTMWFRGRITSAPDAQDICA